MATHRKVTAYNDNSILCENCQKIAPDDVLGLYRHVVYDLGDPRVKDWFPISSPLPTIIILVVYFLLVYRILPWYMQNRKPYSLDRIVLYYNLLQIICCTILVYEIITPLTEPAVVWKCEPFSYSRSRISMKRLTLSYYFYLIKVTELLETIFFLLRKKFNQVSTLHVYHHVTTFMLAWFFAKYFAGGMVSFCMMLNSSVHVVMYAYYLLSSLGVEWKKKIARWKFAITTLQMIQLSVLIVHSSQVLFNKSCGLPNFTFYVYAPNVAIMLYMFKNFYQRSYKKKDSKSCS